MAAENRDHHASLQADDVRQFFLLKSVLNPMGKVVKGLRIDKHHESLLATGVLIRSDTTATLFARRFIYHSRNRSSG
jgi:hypothetical protein